MCVKQAIEQLVTKAIKGTCKRISESCQDRGQVAGKVTTGMKLCALRNNNDDRYK